MLLLLLLLFAGFGGTECWQGTQLEALWGGNSIRNGCSGGVGDGSSSGCALRKQ
jgi:hypothetical protein